MKKKILGIGIVTILVSMLVLLTGCGNEENSNGGNESSKISKNSLASQVKIGDYVDYKIESGKSYTSPKDKTGYDKDQTFETTGEEKWRVLNVSEDGTIDLILDGSIKTIIDKAFYIKGKIGTENFESELSNITNIYLNNTYATSSRSITRSDLENMMDLDATVKSLLKHYDTDLYTHSDINTNGTREEVFESMNKSYYDYYGNTISVDGKNITLNRRFQLETGASLRDCITDEGYKSILEGTPFVWLSENAEMGLFQNDFWTGVEYQLSTFSYNSSFYTLKNANPYTIKLNKISDNTYEKNDETEYSVNANIKPIITLKSNIESNGGNGTSDNPFTLK